MKKNNGDHKTILYGLIVAFSILWCIFYYSEAYLPQAYRDLLYFWIQLATGVTWPDPKNFGGHWPYSSLLVAAAAALSTLLSAGPFLGIIYIVFKLLTEKRRIIMRLAEIFKNRDAAIINEVIMKLGSISREQEQNIEDAVKSGAAFWEQEQLPSLLGKDVAKELMEHTYPTYRR